LRPAKPNHVVIMVTKAESQRSQHTI